MSLSSQHQKEILSIVISLFNASPGFSFFDSLKQYYKNINYDKKNLAYTLAQSELFENQFKNLNQEQTAQKILETFSLEKETSSGKIAYDIVNGFLENSYSKVDIILFIQEYFTSENADMIFKEAIQTLQNKIEVVNYHTSILNRDEQSFEHLKSVISEVNSTQESIEKAKVAMFISKTASIKDINILDGSYTYGSSINIVVEFNDSIKVNNIDSSLTINLGEVKKQAKLSAISDKTLVYKYVVEDGYFFEESSVSLDKNSIVLNNTKITDLKGLKANLNFEAYENKNATVKDTHAPNYKIFNTHYDSKNKVLSLKGEGFKSVLEYDENSNTNIKDRIDFSKLIWQYNSKTNEKTSFIFEAEEIVLAKVLDDNQLNILLSNKSLLQSNVSFGFEKGADFLDINKGLLKDKAGNISNTKDYKDTLLGINNTFLATNDSDFIQGTINDDIINTYGNDDFIFSKEGNDIINAGKGNDTINAGLGKDTIISGEGSDTLVFRQNDSLAYFGNNIGIDRIKDLHLNGSKEDLLDLYFTVDTINKAVSGKIDEGSFINDLNILLNVSNEGFDTSKKDDISITLALANDGNLKDKIYLVADVNSNNTFEIEDFVVEVTGINLEEVNLYSFI